MKKNGKLLSAVILLLAVAIWIWYNQSGSTLKKELRDFAVEDTASISKIRITDKAGKSVTLERNGPGNWMVNGSFVARNDAMNNLLEVIRRVEVRNPVGKKAIENVTKSLATGGIKTEIWLKDELFKVYYVGTETQDNEGTNMLMHDHTEGVNSSMPFVMHIPGFTGYLTPRFFVDEKLWRDKILFRYTVNTLKSVAVRFHRFPDSSFVVSLEDANTVNVTDFDGKHYDGIDSIRTKQYLSYFSSVNFEGIENFSRDKMDSILATPPVHTVTVTDINGKTTTLTTFAKPPVKRKDDLVIKGKVQTEDPDRMWATINANKNEIVLVQFFVIGKLLQGPSYFRKRPGSVNK